MKKEFSLEKNFRVWSRSEVTRYWEGFENDQPLGRGNEDDFPGGKAIEPLQKEKQSKNQLNQKKKKRAKNQAVTTLSPLKKSRPRDLVAQGTRIYLTLRKPFPTRVSFFLYLLFPQEFHMIFFHCSGWFALPFPQILMGFWLTHQILLMTLILSYLR